MSNFSKNCSPDYKAFNEGIKKIYGDRPIDDMSMAAALTATSDCLVLPQKYYKQRSEYRASSNLLDFKLGSNPQYQFVTLPKSMTSQEAAYFTCLWNNGLKGNLNSNNSNEILKECSKLLPDFGT